MVAAAFALLGVSAADAGQKPAPAAPAARGASSGQVAIPFQRFTLPNGLVVILHEDHTLPQVVVDLWYHVGSKEERVGRTGFAHLFEHLMFMGSKDVPYDLDKGAGLFDLLMEAQGGANNASTDFDHTNYFEVGPPRLLETFLWLEADRLATLADEIDRTKLERQRKIVQNERRQSYENRPYGKAPLVICEQMYPPDHPYHHDAIGSHQDLEAATVDDVREFFRRFYVPANASLVIAGDFEPGPARQMAERYFGWIPSRPAPQHAEPPPPPPLPQVRKVTLEDHVELPRTHLVYHAPASYQEGSAECDLLANILGHGKSSRLQRVLRLERQLAQEIQVSCESRRLGGLFDITVTARPGHSLAEIEQAIDGELAALKARPPAAPELQRAVSAMEMTFAQGLEPLTGRADLLNQYEFEFQDPGRAAWDLERYRKVTPEGIQTWARRILEQNRLELHIVPAQKGGKP
jgi:predicted Zn-dependent peptidase